MSNIEYKFPEGFWWGTASSGPQTEGAANIGGRIGSIWDHWYKLNPERFHNNIGAEHTSNFYYQYKDDIKLMKETGHNSFRTSIQWSRLIPNGMGAMSQDAARFYNNVINELIANGIEPFINLHHFDMPINMQDIGGWENRTVVLAYVNFAKTCFELFGDRVKYWFTFNEPIIPVCDGYLYDVFYPNVVDFKRAVQVAHHTIIAHSLAVNVYRSLNLDGKIGIILNLTPAYPRSQNPADLKAAHLADLFFNRSFLDPIVKGEYPEQLVSILREHNMLPAEILDSDLLVIKNSKIDLLGINYYKPRRVKAKEYAIHPNAPFMPDQFFDDYAMPNRKMNVHRGWEIYEKAIYDIAIRIRDEYGNIPFFISENGMGVEGEEKFRDHSGQIQDDYRVMFVREHLKWLYKSIDEGANCHGYHMWTCFDNWSWANAYKNRYGLIEVDIHNHFKRTVKKSGEWFKNLSENNGF